MKPSTAGTDCCVDSVHAAGAGRTSPPVGASSAVVPPGCSSSSVGGPALLPLRPRPTVLAPPSASSINGTAAMAAVVPPSARSLPVFPCTLGMQDLDSAFAVLGHSWMLHEHFHHHGATCHDNARCIAYGGED